jgi:signal transduction histidine kinase
MHQNICHLANRFAFKSFLISIVFSIGFSLNAISNELRFDLFGKGKKDTLYIDSINLVIQKLISENKDVSTEYLNRAFALADSLHYENGKATALLNLFDLAKAQGKYAEALNYGLKALKIFEKEKQFVGIITCHKNLGIICSYERQIDGAIEHFKIALELAQKYVENDVGNCLNNLGVMYQNLKKYNEALEYHNQSLEYQKKFKNEYGIAKSLTNIGIIYREKGECDKALKNLRDAVKYFDKMNSIPGSIMALSNIGFCLSRQGRNTEAIECQNKVMELAKKINDKENLANAYFGLYTTYKTIGDYRNALENHEQLQRISDSVFNEESSRKIAELRTQYETEKKEQEIKIQKLEISKKENQVSLAYGLIVIILLSSYLSYRYYRWKQLQLLKETILNTEISERTRIAKDMHDELGASLTKILVVSEVAKKNTTNPQTIEENINTINKTVKELSSNIRDFVWTLNPENATLENLLVKLREFCADLLEEAGIEFELNFSDEVPELEITKKGQRNLYLAFKESVNNVVRHSGTKNVSISALVGGLKLNVIVNDHGKGFEIKNLKTTGNGLKNINRRIEDIGGKADISSVPGEGTIICFDINLSQLAQSPKNGMLN